MTVASEELTATLEAGLGRLGYDRDRLVADYEFSDVGAPAADTRSVRLAAFTHSPPSYRSAAFGVIDAEGEPGVTDRLGWLSSLGAPVVFVAEGSRVHVMKVGRSRSLSTIATVSPGNVAEFMEAQRAWWAPDAMRRFKLFGGGEVGQPQLDFFDAGLLPAVERQVQAQLGDLLGKVLDNLREGSRALQRPAVSMVFRMLAAKVLLDRRHPEATSWKPDAESVLKEIGNYYNLTSGLGLDERLLGPSREAAAAAWSTLGSGLSLRNVSSDDLAFVYENSFVSEEARTDLGTHNTPRSVVDYACDRLPFDELDENSIRVVEPFSGAGIFLIAAARRLGDRMGHLSPAARHSYLVERVNGSDIEEFACQVAQLSLILADYPNRNGWKVRQQDLFASAEWLDDIGPETIVFCNPPYERFKASDRERYGAAIGTVPTKALWVADRIVGRRPAGLALVLPRAFALEEGFASVRRKLEKSYRDIEILALPEKTFFKAGFETCLVIGKSLRQRDVAALGPTQVVNALVSGPDLPSFNITGVPSWTRMRERASSAEKGTLWQGDLQPLWDDLERRCAPLSSAWMPHRGIEWQKGLQETAWSAEHRPGWRPGYHPNDGVTAFEPPKRGWLDMTAGNLRRNAFKLPWAAPKVLLNAARRSRGRWRVTAFAEPGDMAASQQFIALWPLRTELSLDALAAVLNGPVANAFLNDASFGKGIRLEDLKRVPMPRNLDEDRLAGLVADYRRVLATPGFDEAKRHDLRQALLSIDALVLAAYDLAPRSERMLLRTFSGHVRRVPFRFDEFYPDSVPAIPLREMVDGLLARAQWPRLAPAFRRIDQEDGEAVWGTVE